jgi:alanyl aminopeptidase
VQLIRARMAPIAATTELVDAGGGTVRVTSPQPISPGRWQLRLNFDAPYDLRLQGAYKVKAGGLDYVMTQMEPLGARNAFPCFDEPAFKTTWTASITAPAADTALFNTRETRNEAQSDGWIRHEYATTKPLSSYLIAFAVGPWELVEFAAIPKTALRDQPIPLRGVAAKGQGQRMSYMLGETAKIVIRARGLLRLRLSLRQDRPAGRAGLRLWRNGKSRPDHLSRLVDVREPRVGHGATPRCDQHPHP